MKERLDKINRLMSALGPVWPLIADEVQGRIRHLTDNLITQDNEQERGAIKELRNFIDLPETLQHEREGLTAALSEQDAASN